jgi:hypothetical protein
MYKTRDGDDVKIVAIEDGFAIGYRVKYGPDGVTTWNANNGRFLPGDYPDGNDITEGENLD